MNFTNPFLEKHVQKELTCRKIRKKCVSKEGEMPEDTEVPKGPSDNLKLQNEHFLRVAGTFSPCCGDMEFPQQIYNECMWIQN